MTSFDEGATLANRMRTHAGDDAHLYAHLMRRMADDWESDGPVREICDGWEDAPPGAVVQLRLLAGLFRIVLTGRAPELAPFYACLGGAEAPDGAWPIVRTVLARHVDELHDALDIAPQTNEVGRSVALLVGLFEVVRRTGLSKVRLLEPGASAGLNLRVDQFKYVTADWSFGPADSPLVIADAVVGTVLPQTFDIVSRRGCDLSPVDPGTDDGQLRLRSFVWPFHIDRHERLAAALQIAQRLPVVVDRAGAGEWLERQLEEPVPDDTVTVVWQSITRMYWPPKESARVERALDRGAERQTLAHVAMEFPPTGSHHDADLTVDAFPTDREGFRHTRLATVGDHGIPVTVVKV